MNRWLRQYECFRHNPDAKNDASWLSSKYDLEGLSWDEIREIYIPELGMCFGPSCEALRNHSMPIRDWEKMAVTVAILLTGLKKVEKDDGEWDLEGAEKPEEEDGEDSDWF